MFIVNAVLVSLSLNLVAEVVIPERQLCKCFFINGCCTTKNVIGDNNVRVQTRQKAKKNGPKVHCHPKQSFIAHTI